MIGPSNAEFFRFLETELSFSLFRRSGETLISFKETIEFVLLSESTVDGPEEGLLFEGIGRMSAAEWREFIAGFVMSMVENRIDPGGSGITRVFRATKQVGDRVHPLLETGPGDMPGLDDVPIREELCTEDWRYVWTGESRKPDSVGRLLVHARRIACRGADKGMPARIIFCEKLRQYQRRQRNTVA